MNNIKISTSSLILKNNISYTNTQFLIKRVLELITVLIITIITFPIALYTIYRIKKESKGSLFFTQQRIGLNGKPFTCYKFRTMHENTYFNPYTQDNDKRIFKFGHIMRKMRIDELPQLWNVIKGDMHLIGPRAEWDILVKKYRTKIPNYEKRHSVRPGITGLAQVSYPYGRNLQDAKNKLKYDLYYIKNWSLLLDLKITYLTIIVIIGKKGV